ncbi:MAG: hypothetical protein Q9195_005869 [Heterodermia aff. obscurata]
MSSRNLNAQLRSLFETHKQTLQLINRLAKLQIQPGSSALTSDARIELGAEIHQSLKEQEEGFELLRQEVEDSTINSGWVSATRRKHSDKERDRTDLATQVTRLGENLKTARSQFRKAQLQAKRNAEAAERREKEVLFSGVQEGNGESGHIRRKGQEKLSHDEVLLNASNDVTVALKRAHALMQIELTKSQFAQETLEESTTALSTLAESYNQLDTLLSSSRTLVSSLLRSQKSDTWYLESAFWLLVVTIGWLIFRRILYGPSWWLLYLPTKLIWSLMVFNSEVLLSVLASLAGSVERTKQSSVISDASQRISKSLTVEPNKIGVFPKISSNMPAPSIPGGARDSGTKSLQPDQSPNNLDKSLSDQVGEIAEASEKATETAESTSAETTLKERSTDEPPNPKKRMWEDSASGSTPASHPRDEL